LVGDVDDPVLFCLFMGGRSTSSATRYRCGTVAIVRVDFGIGRTIGSITSFFTFTITNARIIYNEHHGCGE
jgi:hypothetical protein